MSQKIMKHELPKLNFEYNALEPCMDAKTVEIHYTKHHQGYINKLNAALEKHPKLFEKSVEELLSDLNSLPVDIKKAVINHGGGHANHSLFWQVLGRPKQECKGRILKAIEKEFGSFTAFKEKFSEMSANFFGSGWVWLVVNEENNLEIISTANQDSPLSINKKPILVIDLWEHAYYLKYQNRRPEYIEAFRSIINWEEVEELFIKNVK